VIWAAALLLATSACGDGGGGGEDEQAEGGESEGDSETGEPVALGDSCVDTELLVDAPATVRASLRHASPSPLGHVCGATGPVVFVRVSVAGRVDLTVGARGRAYVPKLALLAPGCVSSEGDPERLLGCGEGLPVTLFDIGPDIELLVAVGIDADDPASNLEPDEDGADPLDFELVFELRAVLEEGEICGPARGRCEVGTVCLAEAEGDGVEVERCRRPPADSCVAPGQLALPAPGVQVELVTLPDDPHTDAHDHPCTGWRRPERVEQLEFPPVLPEDTTLVVRADDPRVGLALRGPSCAPEDALACAVAEPGASETTLTWGQPGELAQLAEAGSRPLLFIELPRADVGDEAIGPITLTLELTPG
jgi:hypothetical protein